MSDWIMPDTGCHLHPACLSCTRPRCIHDEGSRSESYDLDRVRELAALGYGGSTIAREMGVSRRTAQRWLREAQE